MPSIKFEDEYCKMPEVAIRTKKALLLQVFNIFDDQLSPAFIDYDTTKKNGEKYKLPKGKLLTLLLKSEDSVWTTVRRFVAVPNKEEYYRKLQGTVFDLEIEKKE